MAFFERKAKLEWEDHTKLEYYLAYLRMEIQLLRMEMRRDDSGTVIHLSDFLVPKQKRQEKKLTMADVEKSKNFFSARLAAGRKVNRNGPQNRDKDTKPEGARRHAEKEKKRTR